MEPFIARNLDDYLINRRLVDGVVRLDGEISDDMVSNIMDELRYASEFQKNIRLEIISPGGDALAAFGLYDYIRMLQLTGVHVNALVLGYAASAADMIVLQACEKRSAMPNARFLLHELRSFGHMVEKTSEKLEEAKEFQVVQNRVAEILAERMKRSPADVRKMFERREYWMGAEEALKLGLIDEIVGAKGAVKASPLPSEGYSPDLVKGA